MRGNRCILDRICEYVSSIEEYPEYLRKAVCDSWIIKKQTDATVVGMMDTVIKARC
jgi:hypothetical protein